MTPTGPNHLDRYRNFETGDRYEFRVSDTEFEDEAQVLRKGSAWIKLPDLVQGTVDIVENEFGAAFVAEVTADLRTGNFFVAELDEFFSSMADSWVNLSISSETISGSDSFKIVFKNFTGQNRRLALSFGGDGDFYTPDGANDSNGIPLPTGGSCMLEFIKLANTDDWYGWYVGGIDGGPSRPTQPAISMNTIRLPS